MCRPKAAFFLPAQGEGVSIQEKFQINVLHLMALFSTPTDLEARGSERKRGGAREEGSAYKSEEDFTTISFTVVLIFAVYCSHVFIILEKNHELLADCWIY